MAFQILVSTLGTPLADMQATVHILREAVELRLEEIKGNCHLFEVGSLGGAA